MTVSFAVWPINNSLGNNPTDQGTIVLDGSDSFGRSWINWFGFMAAINLTTGALTKVPIGPITDANRFFFDGAHTLTAQPNYDFTNQKPHDPTIPATCFVYFCSQLVK